MRNFLNKDLPQGGTKEWAEWEKKAESFGARFPQLCIEILKSHQNTTGYPLEAYTATIALRLYGYEANGWYDENGRWIYKVKGFI